MAGRSSDPKKVDSPTLRGGGGLITVGGLTLIDPASTTGQWYRKHRGTGTDPPEGLPLLKEIDLALRGQVFNLRVAFIEQKIEKALLASGLVADASSMDFELESDLSKVLSVLAAMVDDGSGAAGRRDVQQAPRLLTSREGQVSRAKDHEQAEHGELAISHIVCGV